MDVRELEGEEKMQLVCPFCAFKSEGELVDYQMMLHIETLHPENGEDTSPFMAADHGDASSLRVLREDGDGLGYEGAEDEYVECPQEGCGEALLLVELEGHVEMHEQERAGTVNGTVNGNDSGSGDDSVSQGSSKRIKLDSASSSSRTKTSAPYVTNGEMAAREKERTEHEEYERQFGDREQREKSVNGEDKSKRRRKMSPAEPESSPSKKSAVVAAWRNLMRMPPSDRKAAADAVAGHPHPPARKRLGRAQLGPHAHEKQMPTWLVKLLEADGAYENASRPAGNGKMKKVKWCPNMTSGIVPVLEQLLGQDQETEYAYLCDPGVRHVSKLKREGGFCGYRNIQMLTSYMIAAKAPGSEVFNGKIPSIFDIQEHIEGAWDLGINDSGRIETGGIRGTRKYIGTPEAQAMLIKLGIRCNAQGIKAKKDSGTSAYENLYEIVESYFMDGCADFKDKVRCTSLPSIYFQHPGHSMTIIGFERKTNGSRNLLVFDPMFHDAPNVSRLVGESFKVGGRGMESKQMLTAYRRGTKYLRRYNEFEILRLVVPRSAPVEEVPVRKAEMGQQDDARSKARQKWGGGVDGGVFGVV